MESEVAMSVGAAREHQYKSALLVDCPNLNVKANRVLTYFVKLLHVLQEQYCFNLTCKEAYFGGWTVNLPGVDTYGFKIVKTPADVDGAIIERMHELSEMPEVDRIILASGDEDYVDALKEAKAGGKVVYVAWPGYNTSKKLIEAVGEDHFIHISKRNLKITPKEYGKLIG